MAHTIKEVDRHGKGPALLDQHNVKSQFHMVVEFSGNYLEEEQNNFAFQLGAGIGHESIILCYLTKPHNFIAGLGLTWESHSSIDRKYLRIIWCSRKHHFCAYM